ncbi:MAG: TonB-dependent receptor [Halioglobus sp.]
MRKERLGPMNKLALAVLMTPALASVSLPSYAQMLEEVVVTARKRVESLQDTPIAVSAFGSDDMRAAQINNLADLSQQVPGLTNTDGAKFSGLSIRGVGTRATQVKVDPGVGIYVDGVFMPRSDTQLVDVVAMESMQVLRGPQGTLFGKNTAGGAILMSSVKPTEEFAGNVEVGFGNFDRQELSVRVSGPLISDKLQGALTYDTRNADGYMEDYYTGIDYGNVEKQAVVGQLRYLPTDTLVVDFIALWGESTENAAPRTCQQFNSSATLQGFASTFDGVYGEQCELSESLVDKEKVTMDATGERYEVSNNMAGLTLDWEVGQVEIKSITGYLKQEDLRRDSDQDGTAMYSIGNFSETARHMNANGIDANDESRRFISQEFNLFGSGFDDKLDYTVGVYYSDEDIEGHPGGNTLGLGGWLGAPVGDSVLTLAPATVGFQGANLQNLTSESAAAFGQLIYYFNDMWQFTLGARYTWEEKTLTQDNYASTQDSLGLISREEMNELADFIQPLATDATNPLLDDEADWSEFSPSATITMFAPESWTEGFLNSAMFYVTYSEGFKAGGFSDFGLDEPTVFDPEIVQNTELGFKMDMADQRIRLNGAIYSMDYDELQLGVTRIFGELDTKFGITNAGTAEMKGMELELVFLPTANLYLSFTGSYIDAQYTEFDDEFVDNEGNVELTDRTDEPFNGVPEQTYSWVLQYDWDTRFGLITPRISGFYKDEIYIGQDPIAFTFEEDSTLDSYTIWNARVAFQSHQVEGLEVAVFANNFTDEFYYGTGNVNAGNLGAASLIRGKPMSYGIDFYYNW